MVSVKYGLLTLGRLSVRRYSTLQAWSPLFANALRVSHVRNCLGPVSGLPFSRITSLLEGVEFTPPSSARTKGDTYVPGAYTNIFVLIFRLMRYTDICYISLSGVLFTRD